MARPGILPICSADVVPIPFGAIRFTVLKVMMLKSTSSMSLIVPVDSSFTVPPAARVISFMLMSPVSLMFNPPVFVVAVIVPPKVTFIGLPAGLPILWPAAFAVIVRLFAVIAEVLPVIEPAVEVTLISPVVVRFASVTLPSALRVMFWFPALIVVPSAMVMSPVSSAAPVGIAPASFAVRLIAPLVVLRLAFT